MLSDELKTVTRVRVITQGCDGIDYVRLSVCVWAMPRLYTLHSVPGIRSVTLVIVY